VLEVVIVQEEHGAGIGRVRRPKGHRHIVHAQRLLEIAAAEPHAVVVDGLVDHVPADRLSGVTAHHGGDVVVEGGGERRPVSDQRQEGRGILRVPDQGVPEEPEPVGSGEGGDPVGLGPVVPAVGPQHDLHLHLPVGRDLVEMAHEQVGVERVVQPVGADGGADREGGGPLQGDGRRRARRRGGRDLAASRLAAAGAQRQRAGQHRRRSSRGDERCQTWIILALFPARPARCVPRAAWE
jgi:hypothetical protein